MDVERHRGSPMRIGFLRGVRAAWVALTLGAASAAAEPLVTDRPDFTESAEVVPLGMAQVEGGYTFSQSGSSSRHSFGELLLRMSVWERCEARIGLNSYVLTRAPGERAEEFEDGSLGFKLELLAGAAGWRPATAVIAGVSLARQAAAAAEFRPQLKLATAWGLGARTALSTNLNVARVESGREISGSCSLAMELGGPWGGFVESFGFLPTEPGSAGTAYANGGFTWRAGEDLQLDARIGVGWNGIEPDHFLGLGIARRW